MQQPVGPYQFIKALRVFQVGSVWSAVDPQGRSLTVAVLEAAAASDQRWRDAFAATANALAQPEAGGPRFVHADFSASPPWVAYAADDGPAAERIFLALGMADTTAPVGAPQPVSSPPQPVSAPPQPISVPPQPVSGMPQSPAVGPFPPGGPSSYDPLYSPVRHIVPSEPRRRRTGLWIGIAVLVLVVLAGGGTVFALGGLGGNGTPTSAPASSAPSVALPTARPLSPGVEPPKPGAWPTQWPKFAGTDGIRTLSDLDGLGFTVKVPQNWQCIPGGRAEGFAKYHCGVSPGKGPEIGGELIVRDCPKPCTEEWQVAMRKAEEAWGLQWIRSGKFSAYAESSSLRIDGAQRYGLVVVGYWRSGSEGAVDRQFVFRMTAPVDGANQLRRVANYIRDTVIF